MSPSRPRLIFLDDDKSEIDAIEPLLADEYEFASLHWPRQRPRKGMSADIFVSDLYLPPARPPKRMWWANDAADFPARVLERHRARAFEISQCFAHLYLEPHRTLRAKTRMRRTMDCLTAARERLLDLEVEELGQSVDHGLEVLRSVRRLLPAVPFVFYSRKITPDDVTRVWAAGADDAIQKRDWKDDGKELRRRLKTAWEKPR